MSEAISTDAAPTPMGLYPHARRCGDLLFLSGVGPRSPQDGCVPGLELGADGEIIQYDISAQCHSVFHNVRTILEAAGSSWEKIVDVTVFLTNISDDFKTYNELYAEAFGEVQPTRTTVEVGALPSPIAIELKVIAKV